MCAARPSTVRLIDIIDIKGSFENFYYIDAPKSYTLVL